MIITAKPRIPFSWIVIAALPWVAILFKDKLMGAAFTLSLKNFVDNPLTLSFALVLAPLLSWAVPTIVNFLGDRIWTRFGRRKPFLVFSWVGTMATIFLMPLAPSFEWLVAAYVAFVVFNDLGAPAEALKMEIVPPAQRPVSTAVVQWINQVGVIIYFWVALGRFDEVNDFLGATYSGQRGLFWTVATGMAIMLCVLMLAVKETDPKSSLRGKLNPLDFLRSLVSPHIWPIYILAFSTGLTGAGIGFFDTLLTTEQWGYTNQDLGNNIAIGGILNLCLIPLIGLVASKTGRFRVYVILILLNIVINITRFCYYEFVLYDGRPTITEMVFFGEMFSIVGILSGIAIVPLIYDHVSRNELGVYASGANIVGRLTGIVLTLMMGAFVNWHAGLFMPPAGEAVKVSLDRDTTRSELEPLVNAAPWRDPAGPATAAPLAKPRITARPVFATGARLDHGYGFEIRLAGNGSATSSSGRRGIRDDLDGEQAKDKVRSRYANSSATMAVIDGRDPIPDLAEEAARKGSVAARQVFIDDIDKELQRRSDAFKNQVVDLLKDRLMADGAQVLGSSTAAAAIVSFPLDRRPDRKLVEQTLDSLRSTGEIIDLRLNVEPRLSLDISLLGDGDPALRARTLIDHHAVEGLRSAIATGPASAAPAVAVRLDLRTFEDPLDRHPSPINRGIEAVLGWAIGRHDPERRLRSIGRGLRRQGWIDHAAAGWDPKDDRLLRITAIVGAPPAGFVAGTTAPAGGDAPKPSEAASQGVRDRLSTLGGHAPQAEALYSVAVRAAKEGRMTVARPVVEAGYAKQQYDYMAGYLAVFVIQMLGVVCILIFAYMVKTGRVTKRGVIEAEAAK